MLLFIMVIVVIEKIKSFIKKNKWLFITFFVSSFIISIIYTLKHIAPFGNNSMLDVDFYHQYGPLLNELCDRVKQGENLLYSFNTGGGLPFFRNFLNYLSSPFNIVLFLFRKDDIVMAFSIIIGLKVILSSVSMSFYLKNTFKKDNFLLCLFGILYAFSGYFCAYYWNIMWLDGMFFLPLIMYGINKIVDFKKPYFYVISLSIMLIANYFIAYMICIFSCFYFLGYFVYKKNFKLKNIISTFLMFFISSLLAALLSSFLLLPLYDSLKSISATGDNFVSSEFNFSIHNYLFNHISGVSRTVFQSDVLPLPNVSSGLITLVMILLLFSNKKINIRFKVLSILSILFFFISFNSSLIDFIWHAFHVPNDLPWRYSFIYVFVLVSLGFYSFNKIKEVSIIKISICYSIVIIMVLLASKFSFANFNDTKAMICLIILTIYFIVTCIYVLNGLKKINLVGLLFIFIASFEAVYLISINWNINHDIKNFMSDKKTYQDLISYAKKDDNGLYRIEKTDYLTLNDGAWYDYTGISTFTSMAYEDVSKFQRNFGLAGNNINSYYYRYYSTPVYNTIFNIKYIMGNYRKDDYYVPLYSKDSTYLTGYNYSSSIMYTVNESINDLNLTSYNPLYNQEEFVYKVSNIKNIYDDVNIKRVEGGTLTPDNMSMKGNYTYNLSDEDKTLTLYLDNYKKDNIYIYTGGSKVKCFNVDDVYYPITSDEYYVLDTGKKENDEVKITIEFEDKNPGNLIFHSKYMNHDKFKKFYNYIEKGFLDVEKYNETYIEGNIVSKDNQVVFTTIAYDKGWNVFVDGKKTKTKKVLDSYLSFDIKEGKHKIKMIYYPNRMKEGLIISFISICVLITYFLFTEKNKFKNIKKYKFIV